MMNGFRLLNKIKVLNTGCLNLLLTLFLLKLIPKLTEYCRTSVE